MNFEENYQELAFAIVKQAIKDYRRYIKNDSRRTFHQAQIAKIERFFNSGWCYELCGVDGNVIIAEVKKMKPKKRGSSYGIWKYWDE